MSRLAHLECPSCGGPVGGREAAPLSASCSECGAAEQVLVDVDGVPQGVRTPDPNLLQLGMWVRAVRELVQGEVVCVGACAACAGPLVVPSDQHVRLPCDRCGGHRGLEAGKVVAQPIHGLNAGFQASTVSGAGLSPRAAAGLRELAGSDEADPKKQRLRELLDRVEGGDDGPTGE